jgi:hypothetical protein
LFINAPFESGGVVAALSPEVKGGIVSKPRKSLFFIAAMRGLRPNRDHPKPEA